VEDGSGRDARVVKMRSGPRTRVNALRMTLVVLTVGGCAVRGAPSFSLFGAFFPAWMFCGLLGIFAAICARAGLVSSGLAEVLPLQLFVCTSIGVCVALLAWLFWFGP
jgi:hypothetical protein